ncbi:response regulator [Synechococcus sp. Nb3U1]|uniref:response regulator n=1 Tax=Synechococcus sp. Nb3U1 TaxID=1914529 RepID=UPI001F40DB65|nr:response regulator [Synechococcus sp. Nb3U1]MCF2970232.1 response regulator [Synechococcus sp. Nb3U1]
MTHRLLIIDDEPDIWEMTQLILENLAGWEVLTAGSGPEGIQKAVQEQPEAILLDVMMPGMDGPTTLAHLRALPETRGIPVLLLSAKVKNNQDSAFAHLGVDGILSKPFNAATLASEIAALVGWDPK